MQNSAYCTSFILKTKLIWFSYGNWYFITYLFLIQRLIEKPGTKITSENIYLLLYSLTSTLYKCLSTAFSSDELQLQVITCCTSACHYIAAQWFVCYVPDTFRLVCLLWRDLLFSGCLCLKVVSSHELCVLPTLIALIWKGDVSFTHKLMIFSKQLTTPTVTLSELPRFCFHESFFLSPLTEGGPAVMTTAQMNMWTPNLLLFILLAVRPLWKSHVLKWIVGSLLLVAVKAH